MLKLSHAGYELATWNGTFGTVSISFLPAGGILLHGNDILVQRVPNYPQFKAFNVSQHTLAVVLTAIGNNTVNLPIDWTPPTGINTAADTFVGYLLLDAWIGNTDRHHENWGFIEKREAQTPLVTVHLAPTYDHASSLGRELLDSGRKEKLDNRSIPAYANKCSSALYADVSDKKPMKTFDAFRAAAQRHPSAASVWLERLSSVSADDTLALFNRLPRDRISEIAIEFAQQILEINKSRLLDLREELS